MKTYNYNWLHIESGKTGQRTVTDKELRIEGLSIYEALNKWNSSPHWKYWIEPKGIQSLTGSIKEID